MLETEVLLAWYVVRVRTANTPAVASAPVMSTRVIRA